MTQMSRQNTLFLLTAASVLIILSRMFGLSLSYDEMSTMSLVTRPGFSALFWDNTPPLYYFLLKSWFYFFPDTPESARLLNLLISIPFPILGYKIGERFFGKRQAILTALFFVFSAVHVRYALEIRAYLLFEVLAVWNLYFFMLSLEQLKISKSYWITLILLLCTHYLAILWLCAHLVVYLTKKEPVKDRTWVYILVLLIGLIGFDKIDFSTLGHLDLSILKMTNLQIPILHYLSFGLLLLSFIIFRDPKYRSIDILFFTVVLFFLLASVLTKKIPFVEKYFIFILPILIIRMADISVKTSSKVGIAIIIVYFSINIARLGVQLGKVHSAWPEVTKSISFNEKTLVISDDGANLSHFFDLGLAQHIMLGLFVVSDMTDKNDIYYAASLNSENLQISNLLQGFTLVDTKLYGLNSYEPLKVMHFQKR